MFRIRTIAGAVALGGCVALLGAGTAWAHDDPDAMPSGLDDTTEMASLPSSGASGASGDEVTLKARLSGLNDVGSDGKGSAGATKGTGRAVVHVEAGANVCWSISADSIGAATLAHIHKGAIVANGRVVVDLIAAFKGCTTVDPALAADIATSPESYYVNVHTADFPAGAIRGQLRTPADEIELKARLKGTNEVGGGDPTGRGKLDVDLRGTLICWKFSSTLDGVLAQHIHRGAAGVAGPIVVDFDGNSRGCRDITPSLAAELAANPAGFYGNQHTPGFQAGAIRGQLALD